MDPCKTCGHMSKHTFSYDKDTDTITRHCDECLDRFCTSKRL